MRILTVCGSLVRGGTDRVAQNFTLAYQRAGHQVAVMSLFGGGPRQAVLESSGVEVLIGSYPAILERARAFNADIIHVHRSGANDPDYLDPVREVKHADACVIETNFFGRVDRSEGGRIVDVHLHLSEWCLWRWHNWLGGDRGRQIGVVVPNAVEVADFFRSSPEQIEVFRKSLGIGPNVMLIGRVGQPHGAKWHPSNITAFAEIAPDFPNTHLLLVGLPETYRSMIDALPGQIRNRVHLLEYLKSDQELRDVYSSLDCFLHSAYIGESFGLVLTEAMLCECPAITAARPHKDNSHPEVVGHRRGGLVSGSTHNLGNALREFLANQTLRESVRHSLREWVTSRYSADIVGAAALRAANHALENRDPAKLRNAIEQDSALRSHVSQQRIKDLLANTIGPPSRRDLLEMKVRHTPMIERAIGFYQHVTLYRKLRQTRLATRPTPGGVTA